MSLNAGDLRTLHLNLETQMPSGKQGPTLVKDVSLQDSRKNPPPVRPRRVSTLQDRNKGVTEELKTAISAGDTSSLPTLLDKYLQANIYTLCEGTLAFETISSRSVEVTSYQSDLLECVAFLPDGDLYFRSERQICN